MMTQKTVHSPVRIGEMTIEAFRLPSGEYRISQAQAAEAIKDAPVHTLRFLDSKNPKAMLGEGYTDYKPESIEVESVPGRREQTRINALPLEVVSAYWILRAYQGHKDAFTLITKSLEQHLNEAFGVARTASEREDRLTSRNQQIDQDLATLGENLATDNSQRLELEAYRDYSQQLKKEIEQLRALLAENGIRDDQVS
jgi:hypothetical protein